MPFLSSLPNPIAAIEEHIADMAPNPREISANAIIMAPVLTIYEKSPDVIPMSTIFDISLGICISSRTSMAIVRGPSRANKRCFFANGAIFFIINDILS